MSSRPEQIKRLPTTPIQIGDRWSSDIVDEHCRVVATIYGIDRAEVLNEALVCAAVLDGRATVHPEQLVLC